MCPKHNSREVRKVWVLAQQAGPDGVALALGLLLHLAVQARAQR